MHKEGHSETVAILWVLLLTVTEARQHNYLYTLTSPFIEVSGHMKVKSRISAGTVLDFMALYHVLYMGKGTYQQSQSFGTTCFPHFSFICTALPDTQFTFYFSIDMLYV